LIALAHRILDGDMRGIARAISVIDNELPEKEALIDELFPYCGRAAVWGITGAPGSGKSSLVDLFIENKRRAGQRLAVIAVDPTSPFSGGAILGDRLRMQRHATDDSVFIRSMASRGHLGGLAGATADAIKILDAAGFDLIIVETIGVGQSEIEVVELADLIILILVPGMGDDIQALKAGIMEIGDLFIINKADKDGAAKLKTEIEYVLNMPSAITNLPKPPVLLTSATLQEGIDTAVQKIDECFQQLVHSGELRRRRNRHLQRELNRIVMQKVRALLDERYNLTQALGDWVEQIRSTDSRPYSLVNAKIDTFIKELNGLC